MLARWSRYIVADPIVPWAPAAVLKALAPGNKSERDVVPGARPYPTVGEWLT